MEEYKLSKEDISFFETLSSLHIFHYIWAGMLLLLPVPFIMYTILFIPRNRTIYCNLIAEYNNSELIVITILVILSLYCIIGSVVNFLAGYFIKRCKNYLFILITSSINCFFIPLGTIFGVYSILKLVKFEIKEKF